MCCCLLRTRSLWLSARDHRWMPSSVGTDPDPRPSIREDEGAIALAVKYLGFASAEAPPTETEPCHCARCSPSRLSPPALWVKHDGRQSAATLTMTGCLRLRLRLEHVKVWRFRSLQYGEALGSLSCKFSGRPQLRKRNLLRLHKKKNYKPAANHDQSLAHEFHAQAPLATALYLLRALVAPALSAAIRIERHGRRLLQGQRVTLTCCFPISSCSMINS